MHVRALALAMTLTALAPAAHAIYMPPDIVDIPTERLVTNLEATLAAATPEGRVAILLQLARLHAAAYADKTQSTSVVNPIQASSRPAVVKGPHTDRDVRGALSYLYGRGGNMLEALRRPAPYDAKFKCEPKAVAELRELDGEITLTFRIPSAKEGNVAATKIKLQSTTKTSPALAKVLAPCLLAKLTNDVRFAAYPRASDVTLTFTFETQLTEPHVFYGFGQVTVPNTVTAAPSDEAAAAAKLHLKAARQRYYEAVQAAPEDALAHLGLAWTLEQDGDIPAAMTCYRKTFAMAWAKEKELMSFGLGQRSIAGEAASYLMPLLDKTKDAAEIDELAAAQKKLVQVPRPVTPIVVPLVDDATDLQSLVDASAAVPFDLDGSGLRRAWGWIRPSAAWLVWDPTKRGVVNSALQMFGSVSFWAFWGDGYEALAALDDDRDGFITGSELDGLALWRDLDGDGVSDPGEVAPVADWRIVSLATRSVDDGQALTVPRGVVFADGTTRPTWDWAPMGRAIR